MWYAYNCLVPGLLMIREWFCNGKLQNWNPYDYALLRVRTCWRHMCVLHEWCAAHPFACPVIMAAFLYLYILE